jgi:ubiquinone/menaquinone biosynthesis C-methylase UbiE
VTTDANPVVGGYSDLAEAYDAPANLRSCWGTSTDAIVDGLRFSPTCSSVADIGCGTGHALRAIADRSPSHVRFFGVEPARQMRDRAVSRTRHLPNVAVLDGTFEVIPLPTGSVDHLYSIYAFHWSTDPERAARETRRVLAPAGEMDLVFVGDGNGAEFNRVTTPIVRKYMGRAYMLTAGKMQRQISRARAVELFAPLFDPGQVDVAETFETFYDTLDGHWGWRVRIEGHFSGIPADKRGAFDAEVRDALATLATERGIPYTIHKLHVTVRHPR